MTPEKSGVAGKLSVAVFIMVQYTPSNMHPTIVRVRHSVRHFSGSQGQLDAGSILTRTKEKKKKSSDRKSDGDGDSEVPLAISVSPPFTGARETSTLCM